MGVAEELEALRKQGVTKKNAGELKDAKGLSTPEAVENAIKAEQERIRRVNYSKEATDFLRSPNRKNRTISIIMSTPNEDVVASPPEITESVEAKPPESTEAEEAKAPALSKDITDMIQITNDFAFVDTTLPQDVSNEGGENPFDCLFGSPKFCPVDSEGLEGATRSVRGAFDEHIAPKVDEATKSVRGAFDEHIVPSVDGATKSIRGAYDEHIVPNVEKVRKQSMESVESLKRKSMETIDLAKSNSIRTIDSVKSETQRIFGEVQKKSGEGVESVRKQSLLFVERSKAAVDGVSAKTMEIVNEKVKPGYQNMVETSKTAIRTKTEECQSMCSALVKAVTVTYAPYYTGTATGWASLAASPAWYFVLIEASFRAFGRVVFCDNPFTGMLILIGMLCSSPFAAFCALLGALTANAAAIYLELDEDIVRSGQLARNAVLIGASVVDSFDFDFPATGNLKSGASIVIFLSIALAPITLLLEYLWMKKMKTGIPSLLLPYNIVLLLTVFCAKIWNFAMATQVKFTSPADIDLDEVDTEFSIFDALFNGLSRTFFVGGNMASGILILFGVLFCSRIIASSLVAGAFVSSFVLGYVVFEENRWYLDSGYAGFNPALCTAGIFFHLVPSGKLTGLALFGIIATMIVQGAVDVVLGILGAPVSTSLGFCLTLIYLLTMDLGSFFEKQEEDYFIRTVPKAELSTPEDYLKSIGAPALDQPTDSSSGDEEDGLLPEGEEVGNDDDGTGMESAVVATVDDDDKEDPKSPLNEETPLLG